MSAAPSPERRRAYELLEAVRRGSRADEAIERVGGGLDARGRAFLTELGYGTIRWKGLLDHRLDGLLEKGIGSLPGPVVSVLETGAYQLLFMDSVPAFAAVDESVALAREALPARHRGWAPGLVNGVLRNLERTRDRPGLPDPESDLAAHLAIRWSHPRWLVERWLERWGREPTERLLARDNAPPSVHLAVQPGRIDRETALDRLVAEGIEARPHPLAPGAIILEGGISPERLPGWEEGWFWVQDAGAQLVVDVADVPHEGLVLDACSAPGAKLAGLATRGASGVLALDVDHRRLRRVAENVDRLGLAGVRLVAGDARAVPTGAVFALILVDAPCSGTGVLARRPDARWRRRPGDPDRFARYQREILDRLADRVEPGGTLVYATCTLEPEENQDVVGAFLDEHEGFRLDPVGDRIPDAVRQGAFLATRPWEHDLDGMFAVRLRREE
ncbi:MAG: 16S rRNA (cytosine(967)-C(5))-methyltransferase RsmB [Gemmatimonadetes bacterium]|nr:16S rRNA (cytosine(967)-C(5))-methyltransferase RsmB [Gemmatimonadota bacterium]